jgi:hypothetical protein
MSRVEHVRSGVSPETEVFEVESGHRFIVEQYDDAEGARVVAGGVHVDEDVINDVEEALGCPVDAPVGGST